MATEEHATASPGIEFYGGYQVYSETGVDLTLLRANLKRTIDERLEKNLRGIRLVAELAAAGRPSKALDMALKRPRPDLEVEKTVHQLAEHHVQFVLIGGLAMRVRGSAHVTEDFDFCYARTTENITALAAALAPLHPYLRGAPPGLPFKLDPPTIQAGLNFTLESDWGDIDLLGEVKGIGTFEQVLAQSDVRVVFGVPIQVLTLSGLIISKKAAARYKDHGHIVELEELKKMEDAEQGETDHA